MRIPLVIAVTGHRDLVDSEKPAISASVRSFFEQMMDEVPDRQLQLLTGLAEGSDQLVAEVAIEMGLEIIAVLPMDISTYRSDFKGDSCIRQFDHCLSLASDVIELLPAHGASEGEIADPGPARDAQYAQQGVFLAAHCHVLLALWDGKNSGQLGGTADVVRFHHDNYMPGYTDSVFATQQMLIDDESDLVYHIVCSRDRDHGQPAEGLHPLETWWFSKDIDEPRSKAMPLQHKTIFARSAEFGRDSVRHQDLIRRTAYPLARPDDSATLPDHMDDIERIFCAADVMAIHYQRKVIRTLRITHVLAFLMGLSFIFYADVDTERTFMIAFLCLFLVSAVIHMIAKHRSWHRKYLDYRALAEGLRVQFYWAAAGVRDENNFQFPHDNFLRSQESEIGWIRNVMRVAGLRINAARSRQESGLEFTLREWVGDDERGQLSYFNARTVDRERKNRLTEGLGLISLLTSVLMITVFVFAGHRLPEEWIGPLLATMGALLLIYGIRQGYAYALAEKELIKQYRFMSSLFANARLRIDGSMGEREQRQILRALGRAALDEHSEWLVMHRSRFVDQSDIWRMSS
jgi:hypothetical protein